VWRLLSPERGGVITSIITTILAFLIGGLVVAATGHDPFKTYKGIFDGTGLNWLFPWVTGADRDNAAFNLQQTLLITTTLILTGLAVAFAFRCGLFNIGGQGQWTMGAIVSVWVGSSWAGLAGPTHIFIAIVLAALAGAAWAGIAGFLKATVGAHEVITTIMLNWIAYWVGSYLFGLGGPLQNDAQSSIPISNDVVESARLPIVWGSQVLQGLHIGIFIAIGALVAYWLILSRTTLGFRVRAVGRNPEAARYGGISVRNSYFLAMAISGGFAGLGGAMDMLGWQFRLGTLDVQNSTVGFIGIAVALLGRNTAIGVAFASLLFGALLYGTSTRSLDPDVFDPTLAGNLTTMIQALVLLFIGADVLVLYLWRRRGWPRPRMPRMPRWHRVPHAWRRSPSTTRRGRPGRRGSTARGSGPSSWCRGAPRPPGSSASSSRSWPSGSRYRP
jgi:simple sugar transport system permease protein